MTDYANRDWLLRPYKEYEPTVGYWILTGIVCWVLINVRVENV